MCEGFAPGGWNRDEQDFAPPLRLLVAFFCADRDKGRQKKKLTTKLTKLTKGARDT